MSLCKVRAQKSVSENRCKNGHISKSKAFMTYLHNVTLVEMDITKKCHIMQKYKKYPKFKDMPILTLIVWVTFVSSAI